MMKGVSSALKMWVVFGITAFIFSFMWQDNPELANSYLTAVRFAFLRMISIVAFSGAVIACILKNRFRFCMQDCTVLLYCSYVWIRYCLGGMVEYRVRLVLLLMVLYFVFRFLASMHRRASRMMQSVFMLAVIVEGIYGFCQLYGGVSSGHALYRLTGSFFNPAPYSCFLAVGLSVAFSRLLVCSGKGLLNHWPHRWAKIFLQGELLLAWGCFIVAVMLLPAGMSRSAWLAAGAGCIIVAWQHGFRKHLKNWMVNHRKSTIAGIIGGILLLSSVGAGAYVIKKDSADGRLLIWKISLLAMQQHPWIGAGLGHFSGVYGQAQSEWFAQGKATAQEENVAGAPEYGFNEYLQIGVELGAIGLLLFLLVLGFAFVRLLRTAGKDGIAGGLLCWAVFAWFSYPLSILPLCVTFVWLLALSVPMAAEPTGNDRWVRVAVALACLLLTIANVPWNKDKQQAYVSWREEQTYFNMKIYEGTVDNYARLYPLLHEEPRFLFEYGQCLAKTMQYEESSRILKEATALSGDPMFYNIMGKNQQALGHYAAAEACFFHAARMVPNRLYPLYLQACLYFDTRQYEKARAVAFRLLQKEPKVMSDAVREMKEEIKERLDVLR